MKHINHTCVRQSAKLFLKNVTQIIKNLSVWKRTKTILNPEVQKTTMNHTTPIQKDVICVCSKNWE